MGAESGLYPLDDEKFLGNIGQRCAQAETEVAIQAPGNCNNTQTAITLLYWGPLYRATNC